MTLQVPHGHTHVTIELEVTSAILKDKNNYVDFLKRSAAANRIDLGFLHWGVRIAALDRPGVDESWHVPVQATFDPSTRALIPCDGCCMKVTFTGITSEHSGDALVPVLPNKPAATGGSAALASRQCSTGTGTRSTAAPRVRGKFGSPKLKVD